MRRKIRTRGKVMLVLLTAVIWYNEFYNYYIQSWMYWPEIRCPESSANCLKVLLVADPQLIGDRFSLPFPLGLLEKWDSDRYIHKTFQLAFSFFLPEVVVFLGDLMDEGTVSSDEEFVNYLERFWGIFQVVPSSKVVIVPGDNDIGGEDETVYNDKLERFQQSFSQPDTLSFQYVEMFKVNRLTFSYPSRFSSSMPNKTRVIVSHMPLLFVATKFVQRVISSIQPHVVFSAHEHKSMHITSDTGNGEETSAEAILPGDAVIYQYHLSESMLHEIVVPTCSYRMGVQQMGYGAAVIDSDRQELLYTVLWSPPRFKHLFIYAGVLAVITVILVIFITCRTYCIVRSLLCRRPLLVLKNLVT